MGGERCGDVLVVLVFQRIVGLSLRLAYLVTLRLLLDCYFLVLCGRLFFALFVLLFCCLLASNLLSWHHWPVLCWLNNDNDAHEEILVSPRQQSTPRRCRALWDAVHISSSGTSFNVRLTQ